MNHFHFGISLAKNLDLQVDSLVGNFKKISAFHVYALCFHETFHDKWCYDKTLGKPENDLERGFV